MGVDLTRICALKDGRTYAVDDDVLGIARDLYALSPSIVWRYPEAVEGTLELKLRYSFSSDLFIVYVQYELADGQVMQELVGTAPECDARLYNRIAEIVHPSYDFAEDMAKSDAEKQAAIDHQFNETMGELAQHLAHALRKDMGIFFKTFIPKGIEPDGDISSTSR